MRLFYKELGYLFGVMEQELRAAEPSEKHEQVEKVVEAAHDKQVQVLEELKDRVPESAQRGIERAIEKHEELAAPPGKGGERPTRPTASPRPGGDPARRATEREPRPLRVAWRELLLVAASLLPQRACPQTPPSPSRWPRAGSRSSSPSPGRRRTASAARSAPKRTR